MPPLQPAVRDGLLGALVASPNFKVRINAALALSVPGRREFYGTTNDMVGTAKVPLKRRPSASDTWPRLCVSPSVATSSRAPFQTLLAALASVDAIVDFAEYKYQATLEAHVRPGRSSRSLTAGDAQGGPATKPALLGPARSPAFPRRQRCLSLALPVQIEDTLVHVLALFTRDDVSIFKPEAAAHAEVLRRVRGFFAANRCGVQQHIARPGCRVSHRALRCRTSSISSM